MSELDVPDAAQLREIAQRIAARGGRALLVGGCVRDALLGLEPKDVDVEVHGLSVAELAAVLGELGREVIEVGRAFGVLRVKGLDVDFSLPRRDSKRGAGHRGFDVEVDPQLGYPEAARRRDLTVNSMARDLLSGELLDPFGGREDLAARRLRATDAAHFAEDPLRGIRVAQLRARFELEPDAELVALCRALDLSELAGERIFEELRKLLVKGRRPSLGLETLRELGYLRFFPELEALPGVPQDPRWHPEGDVWIHTGMVVDAAARLRDGGDDDRALMFGALCHDFGKPATTLVEASGRVSADAHDQRGVPLAVAFLERLRAPGALVSQVAALVRHHLAPAQLDRAAASPRAYRRLTRALSAAGVSPGLLERLARADHLGRTTDDARAGRFPAGDRFLARVAELGLAAGPGADAVRGRDLIARGLRPGAELGELLARCREIQDETGWTDPEAILERVLGSGSRSPSDPGGDPHDRSE